MITFARCVNLIGIQGVWIASARMLRHFTAHVARAQVCAHEGGCTPVAALRQQIPGSYGRPKWRQRDITAAAVSLEERRELARGQRQQIEIVAPRLDALCYSVEAILRLTGQPPPVNLPAFRDGPVLRLVSGRRR